MSSTLGKMFSVTIFGESHGECVGCVVDGCPAGLVFPSEDMKLDLNRRRPATRSEPDEPVVLSGVFNACTTGAPICMVIWNTAVGEESYSPLLPRPGHADYTAYMKYGGFNDYRGGGMFSGRLTAPIVMAGAVAKTVLSSISVGVVGKISDIGGVIHPGEQIELIKTAEASGNTLGGTVSCRAEGLPVGLGEPFINTLDGEISKAMYAIPGVKGVEFGIGFNAARQYGSCINDSFVAKDGKVGLLTNSSGGVLGGISNGAPLDVCVAFKPPPSIQRVQKTINMVTLEEEHLAPRPRQDVCYVPRVVVVVEAVMAIVLCDFAIQARLIPEVIK